MSTETGEDDIFSIGPLNETDFRIVLGTTKIDYGPEKETRNRAKHKYSLESAAFFLQRRLLPIPGPLFMTSEPFLENNEFRQNHMTLDNDGRVVLIVTTMRAGHTVRVISIRPAGKHLKEKYCGEARALGYPLPRA